MDCMIRMSVLLLLGLGLVPARGSERAPADLGTVKEFALPDAKGHKHTAADWKGKKAVVLLRREKRA